MNLYVSHLCSKNCKKYEFFSRLKRFVHQRNPSQGWYYLQGQHNKLSNNYRLIDNTKVVGFRKNLSDNWYGVLVGYWDGVNMYWRVKPVGVETSIVYSNETYLSVCKHYKDKNDTLCIWHRLFAFLTIPACLADYIIICWIYAGS